MESRFTGKQLKRAKACAAAEQPTALARAEGIEPTENEAESLLEQSDLTYSELSDEQLEGVVGGFEVIDCQRKISDTVGE